MHCQRPVLLNDFVIEITFVYPSVSGVESGIYNL